MMKSRFKKDPKQKEMLFSTHLQRFFCLLRLADAAHDTGAAC